MTENANPENIVDEITSIRNRLKEIDTKLKERQLRGTKTAFYIQNALFVFVELLAGTTSTTVNNSNIHTYAGHPMITPRMRAYYSLLPYVSSKGNGTFTISHDPPTGNVGINVQIL